MIAELLGLGTGTAILRYKQSSLWGVFGFHISAPGNPGNMVSVIWIHALGRLWACFTPDHLEFGQLLNNSKFQCDKKRDTHKDFGKVLEGGALSQLPS